MKKKTIKYKNEINYLIKKKKKCSYKYIVLIITYLRKCILTEVIYDATATMILPITCTTDKIYIVLEIKKKQI